MNLAFVSGAPLRLHARKSLAVSSPRPRHATRPSPRHRPRCATLPDPPRDDVPPEIAALNASEVARRMLLDAEEAAGSDAAMQLSDEQIEGLFSNYPHLRAENARVEAELAGVDTSDPEVYSWFWRRWLKPAPSRRLVAGVVVAACAGLLKLVAVVRARFSPHSLALAVARFDCVATVALFGVLGPLLLVWTLLRDSPISDAPRRLSLTTTISSLMLPATSALVASGYITTGLSLGALVRLVVLPLSLWMWEDLSLEVQVMDVFHRQPVATAFTFWRAVATVSVLVVGGCLRVLALAAPDFPPLPVRNAFADSALQIRMSLAARFPVAMSLMGDPGGLAFLAALVIVFGLSGALYSAVFVSDFFSKRTHRKIRSVFANFLIAKGIYLPNKLKNRESLLSTAPPGVQPLFPMPAMMLRDDENIRGMGMGGVATVPVPRILQLLAEEDAVMKAKGMPRWMPPRSEFIPITQRRSALRRSQDFLRNWARPLDDSSASGSFVDFFESIDDENEYIYDPKTEDWVFSDDTRFATDVPEDIPSDDQTVGQIWSAAGKASAGVVYEGGQGGSDGGDGDGQPTVKITFTNSNAATNINLNDPDAGTLV
jgi:Protein of unknown function (DUF3177)